MSDNRCTHGQHHSYCEECLSGPPLDRWAESAAIAVTAALALARKVATSRPGDEGLRGLELDLKVVDAAEYARDEINRALAETEWSDDVSAWVWYAGSSHGQAQTSGGRERGFEIRLQRSSPQ